jgi:hypothetical protein
MPSRRRASRWFALTPLVVVPLLRRETLPEYERLLTYAAVRPRWWTVGWPPAPAGHSTPDERSLGRLTGVSC